MQAMAERCKRQQEIIGKVLACLGLEEGYLHGMAKSSACWVLNRNGKVTGLAMYVGAMYSPFQKECPIWGPAAGDQLLLRPVICGADVRPRGCREVALVSLARAAWAVAMQSAHARALLPALPWQLM